MVSSKLLVITTFLAAAHGVQAMNHQSPSSSPSSSPQSNSRASSPAAKIRAAAIAGNHQLVQPTALTRQQIFDIALIEHFLNHPPIKTTAQLPHFDGLIKDIDTHIRGASMSSHKVLFLSRLKELRLKANAASNALLANAPRLQSRQLAGIHGSPSKPATPPAQQPQALALPVVNSAQQSHKKQKPNKQSSIQAARAKK